MSPKEFAEAVVNLALHHFSGIEEVKDGLGFIFHTGHALIFEATRLLPASGKYEREAKRPQRDLTQLRSDIGRLGGLSAHDYALQRKSFEDATKLIFDLIKDRVAPGAVGHVVENVANTLFAALFELIRKFAPGSHLPQRCEITQDVWRTVADQLFDRFKEWEREGRSWARRGVVGK